MSVVKCRYTIVSDVTMFWRRQPYRADMSAVFAGRFEFQMGCSSKQNRSHISLLLHTERTTYTATAYFRNILYIRKQVKKKGKAVP